LPYTGAGSGITRALKFTPDIKFVNDEMLNEFVVTVERRNVGETDAKNDRYSDRDDRDKLLNESDLDKINIKQNDRDDRDNEVEILGGVILIMIGVKILVSNLLA
jgi:hypothetical protein